MYDIEHSILKKSNKNTDVKEMDISIANAEQSTVKYLFTTKTCPNCALAKEMLADEDYVLIDAEEETEMTEKFGIMQAPTLVVVNGDNSRKYVNASNIQKFVDAR